MLIFIQLLIEYSISLAYSHQIDLLSVFLYSIWIQHGRVYWIFTGSRQTELPTECKVTAWLILTGLVPNIQHILRNIHTVCDFLCHFTIWQGRVCPSLSGLLHWVNDMIAPLQMKYCWKIWTGHSHYSHETWYYNHNKNSTAKRLRKLWHIFNVPWQNLAFLIDEKDTKYQYRLRGMTHYTGNTFSLVIMSPLLHLSSSFSPRVAYMFQINRSPSASKFLYSCELD